MATGPDPRARSMEFVFDSRVSFSNTGKRSTAVEANRLNIIYFKFKIEAYHQFHCWRKRSGTIPEVS